MIEDNIDIPRAVVLASEIQDPAIRLHAQGEIATYWALGRPETALSWAQFLPERVSPRSAPADDSEQLRFYFYDTREKILQCCIQSWTAANPDADGRLVYPLESIDAARQWIAGSALQESTKTKLLLMLPKP